MIDFDRFVFFGQTPTEWLQAHLYDRGVVHPWDVFFTLVYTSYFIVPFATAGFLWARDRLAFLRFVKRLVTLAVDRAGDLHRLSRGAALDGRQRRACSTASNARPRWAGGFSTFTTAALFSSAARGRSTRSPPSPRCTRPSRRWW